MPDPNRLSTTRSTFRRIVAGALVTLGGASVASARQSAAVPPTPPASESAPAGVSDAAGANGRELPATPSGPLGRVGEVLPLPLPAGRADEAPPGEPSTRGRPRPGSIFNPGAAGPGISRSGGGSFLDGALDPDTGWPFVFLDHFKPQPDRVANLWIVDTRNCPQVMGSDPWSCLRVRHFDARGNLVEVDPVGLFRQSYGRPVLVQVQGSLTTPDVAIGGLLWTHSWLERDGGIMPGTVTIAFDWPSQRIYRNDVRDINEKGRRAYIAGYHLARFVQAFPPESRICLLGQSYGGRVVPSAIHLLGGGALNSQDHDEPVALPGLRPDLHVRGVILGAASDRNWLDPGERLDRVLYGCEAFLNLYNSRDEALRFYPMLFRSDHHHAIGKVGLKARDFERLGPLAARYREHDVDELLGREHTLLDATANRQIARWIAPYAWAPDPGPKPERDQTAPLDLRRFGRNRGGRR